MVLELVGEPPQTTKNYEPYRSEEVREKAYRLDGVLLPTFLHIPICFIEVQARLDVWFYHRLFSEIFLYLHQNKLEGSWRAIVVFWDKSAEPKRHAHCKVFLKVGWLKWFTLNPC